MLAVGLRWARGANKGYCRLPLNQLDDKNYVFGSLCVQVMFEKGTDITHTVVIKKLHEIVSARGRKGTNRKEQIELLRELRSIASQNNLGVAIDLKVLFNITAAIYDYNPNVATCMKPDMWIK